MRTGGRPAFPFVLLRFWSLRILPAWCGIALVIFLMQIAVSAIMHDNEQVRTLLAFLDMLPSIIKTALGGEVLQAGNTTGLLTVGYQHPSVMFLCMLFAVGVPTGLLTAEVQRGTMELILSRAITKTQVYICACILTVTGMFALVMVMFLGTVVAVQIYDFGEAIQFGVFFRIAVNAGLLASTFGAFALISAAVFSRLYCAVGISVAFLTANYFVAVTAEWWPAIRFLRRATLFYLLYYSDLWNVWPVENMVKLAAILVAAAVLGGILWHRRDLPL
jgi:ABC-type transport system involved in multi-copper enzyme maturation permease subunit